MMSCVKARVTLSLDAVVVDYLTRQAKAETGGNLSALVDRMIRPSVIADASRRCDEYDRQHPETAADLAEWDEQAAADRDRRWAGAEW